MKKILLLTLALVGCETELERVLRHREDAEACRIRCRRQGARYSVARERDTSVGTEICFCLYDTREP